VASVPRLPSLTSLPALEKQLPRRRYSLARHVPSHAPDVGTKTHEEVAVCIILEVPTAD